MNKVEEILIQCIEDIKAGRASLEDCLNRYPEVRHELEPLLNIALSIKAPADIKPSNDFKIRARVNLMEHIHDSQSKKKAGRSSQASVRYGWYTGWARAAAIVVAVILVISAAGTGTAFASQSSLPGDTLYSVKLGTEQLQRIITSDDAAEVELELKFASTRLDELEKLASTPAEQTAMTNGNYDRILTMSIINIPLNEPKQTYITRSDRIAIAITGYERNLNLAITKAEKIRDGETSLETVALAVLTHLDRLDDIEDEASEVVRGLVANSKGVAINGNIKALQGLAKVNPVRAAEINLQAMQGRLNRAEAEAARDNDKGAEDALEEFEKLRRFGEEISQIAQGLGKDVAIVEELVAKATTIHLEVLSKVYEQLPEPAREAVERAMEESIKGYERAAEALEKAGSDNIPERPVLPPGVPEKIKEEFTPFLPVDIAGQVPNKAPGRK